MINLPGNYTVGYFVHHDEKLALLAKTMTLSNGVAEYHIKDYICVSEPNYPFWEDNVSENIFALVFEVEKNKYRVVRAWQLKVDSKSNVVILSIPTNKMSYEYKPVAEMGHLMIKK